MLGLTDAPVRLDDSGLRSVLAADVTIRSIERFEKPLWQGRAFQLLAGAKAQAGERISRAWQPRHAQRRKRHLRGYSVAPGGGERLMSRRARRTAGMDWLRRAHAASST